MSRVDVHHGELSEMSSDDEFFDPEGDVPAELPSPSWLTRKLNETSPTGAPSTRDEAKGVTGTDAKASPTLASSGSLDLSQIVATKPGMEADEDDARDATPGTSEAGPGRRQPGTRPSPAPYR